MVVTVLNGRVLISGFMAVINTAVLNQKYQIHNLGAMVRLIVQIAVHVSRGCFVTSFFGEQQKMSRFSSDVNNNHVLKRHLLYISI